MSLPTLGETYSLLADVRSTEIKRQREEERQYRKDLRRDQLKATIGASLVGAIVNPLAKQVTAGISGVIQDKFGDRLEKFNLLESVRDQKKKFDSDYEQLTSFNEKYIQPFKESNMTVEEYYDKKILPTLVEDELQTGLFNSKLYNNQTTIKQLFPRETQKNQFIQAIIERNPDIKQQRDANLEAFKEVIASYNQLGNKADYETKLLPKIKKVIGRDGIIPAIGRKVFGKDDPLTPKIDESTSEGLFQLGIKLLETDPILQNTTAGREALETFRKTGLFDQKTFNDALDQREDVQRFGSEPTVKVDTETILNEFGETIGTVNKITKTFPVPIKTAEGWETETITRTKAEEINTPLGRKRKLVNNLRDKPTYWKSWYDELTTEGQQLLEEKLNQYGKGKKKFTLDNVISQSATAWRSYSDDEVLAMFDIIGDINATSKAGIFSDENIAKQFRGSIGGKRLSAATRTLDDLEVNYNTRLQQLRTEFPTLSLAQVKNKILEDDSFSITTSTGGRITLYEQAKQEYLIEFENYTRAINTFSLESGRGLGVIQ